MSGKSKIVWLSYLSAWFWLLSFSLWLGLWFQTPYSTEKPLNIITMPCVLMVIFCLLGITVSIKRRPVLMALISVCSFFPIGWYLLSSPGVFKIIGGLNIACFFLSIFTFYSLRYDKYATTNGS